MKNLKTTIAGVAVILGAIVIYLIDKTRIETSITALIAGIGLLLAGDAKKEN